MNNLEKQISKGAVNAFKAYGRMSGDGYWLSDAPEHFIHVVIALRINKALGHGVFLETSAKKNDKRSESKRKGKESGSARKRFDIVVWRKATPSVCALIEIKHSYLNKSAAIQLDAKKLRSYRPPGNNRNPDLYLLAYREATRRSTCETYGRILAERAHGKLVYSRVERSLEDDWHWSVALIRLL